MLRIGLLGSGFVADLHMKAYKNLSKVDIVAVGSRSSAPKFATKWGIKKTFSGQNFIEELCKDPEIDAIDISLPNFLHQKAIISASENKKNIIVEKPLARNFKEASEIFDIVKRAGILHGYAENQLFMPHISKAKEIIESGILGKIVRIRSREAHFGPHSQWFWNNKLSGGGCLLDMGSHSIEIGRKFIGEEPMETIGNLSTNVHQDKTKAEDDSIALVKYSKERMVVSENSWAAHGGLDMRFEFYGTEGVMFLDVTRETGMSVFIPSSNKSQYYIVEKGESQNGWLYPVLDEIFLYGYLSELTHFTSSFEKDEMPRENVKDGVKVNAIIDAVYKSTKSKRWEKVV